MPNLPSQQPPNPDTHDQEAPVRFTEDFGPPGNPAVRVPVDILVDVIAILTQADNNLRFANQGGVFNQIGVEDHAAVLQNIIKIGRAINRLQKLVEGQTL